MSGATSNGKGDDRRPTQISQKEFEERWDKIFKPTRPTDAQEELMRDLALRDQEEDG